DPVADKQALLQAAQGRVKLLGRQRQVVPAHGSMDIGLKSRAAGGNLRQCLMQLPIGSRPALRVPCQGRRGIGEFGACFNAIEHGWKQEHRLFLRRGPVGAVWSGSSSTLGSLLGCHSLLSTSRDKAVCNLPQYKIAVRNTDR